MVHKLTGTLGEAFSHSLCGDLYRNIDVAKSIRLVTCPRCLSAFARVLASLPDPDASTVAATARLLGARGGDARAAAMSPERRQDIARTAGQASKPARHLCWKGGWALCTVCQGRLHMDGCRSKRRPDRDCCIRRHQRLHEEGHRVGLDDGALPMFDMHRPTWA